MGNATSKITNSLFWTFFERIASQGVSLVISIILARLLPVEDFGVISAVQIFTSIASIFVTGGISNALIQKKNADDLDYSSMFYYNTAFSVLIYFVIFFSAPWLVKLLNASYDYDLLTKVLRVSGIGFVFSSFNSFYRTRLVRDLKFKKTFIITILGTVSSAVVGIYMAYRGYGVWSLVIQHILSYAINSVLLVAFSMWIPKLCFSFSRLKPMLSYGYKLMLSSLLTTVYLDASSLVIGNRYDSSALAFYKKGLNFPKLIVSNLMSAINTVLFPIMAKIDTADEHKDFIKKFNKFSTFVIAPMMFGFAAVAPAFIEVLLGEKWLPCVPFLQLACLDYALQPIGVANLEYWKASGKATLYLVTDIIKKVIGLSLIAVAVFINKGVIWIMVAQVMSTVISAVITIVPNKKLLGYSLFRQIKDVLPQYLLAGFMFVGVYLLGMGLNIHPLPKMIIQIALGIVTYIGGAKLTRIKEFDDVLRIAKGYLKRGKKE